MDCTQVASRARWLLIFTYTATPKPFGAKAREHSSPGKEKLESPNAAI